MDRRRISGDTERDTAVVRVEVADDLVGEICQKRPDVSKVRPPDADRRVQYDNYIGRALG